MAMNDLEDFKCINIKELARLMRISLGSAYNLVRRDSFYPSFRVGCKWLINVEKLKQWIDEQYDKME